MRMLLESLTRLDDHRKSGKRQVGEGRSTTMLHDRMKPTLSFMRISTPSNVLASSWFLGIRDVLLLFLQWSQM